jgi:hypothetical protein
VLSSARRNFNPAQPTSIALRVFRFLCNGFFEQIRNPAIV